VIRRIKGTPAKHRTRFDKLNQEQILLSIEVSLKRTAECFEGLDKEQYDMGWLLQEMETQLEAALAATQVLRDREVAL